MRIGAWICAATILSLSHAQEKPLGDVAREARTGKTPSAHPAKVITNEEDTPVKALTPADNPATVVSQAGLALLRDSGHRCSRETSGNSGPGWADTRVTEVAGRGRLHFIMNELRPTPKLAEFIIIGGDGYRRTGNGPWEKLSAQEMKLPQQGALAATSAASQLPDVLKFRYEGNDLKFVAPDQIDGVPTFLYQYSVHAGDMDRTIRIWIGVNDNLPRKTQMNTVTKESLSQPITWQESTSCAYGVTNKIDPPI